MTSVFILGWDKSLVGDEEWTAQLVQFPRSNEIVRWMSSREVPVPDPACFAANAETCRKVDYPDNDVNWPIMSARMRDILLPHSPPHRLIPTAMLDFEVPFKKRMAKGKPAPGVTVGDFAAVQ